MGHFDTRLYSTESSVQRPSLGAFDIIFYFILLNTWPESQYFSQVVFLPDREGILSQEVRNNPVIMLLGALLSSNSTEDNKQSNC
jgi:hypothetical protein